MELNSIILILIAHYIGDFIFQTSWMAENKSDDARALIAHVGVYSVTLLVFICLILNTTEPSKVLPYVVLNGSFHCLVDVITSQFTKKLWNKKDYHNFFVVVGLDQLIHLITLIGILKVITG